MKKEYVFLTVLASLFIGSKLFAKPKTPTETGGGTGGNTTGIDKNRPSGVSFAVFNKNFGNIRNAGRRYAGEITPTGNIYKKFDTWQNGAAAMIAHIQRYIKNVGFGKLNTINLIIRTYAPSSENDTTGYIAFVERKSGINRHAVLDATNKNEIYAVCKAMSQMEDSKATEFFTRLLFDAAWVTAEKQNN